MIVCAAIHGILTRQTSASWPDEFDVWMSRNDPSVRVIKKEYIAGPFPWVNWFRNRLLARGLAAELELFSQQPGETDLWMVAHSNGACVAMDTVRLLTDKGIRVAGVILTGGACESDVDRIGVETLVRYGLLGRAVAFASRADSVVRTDGWRRLIKWPYGNLGRVGWMRDGKPYRDERIFTLWFGGGHCGYFADSTRDITFTLFDRIIHTEEQ